jgi:hypothetical protein
MPGGENSPNLVTLHLAELQPGQYKQGDQMRFKMSPNQFSVESNGRFI